MVQAPGGREFQSKITFQFLAAKPQNWHKNFNSFWTQKKKKNIFQKIYWSYKSGLKIKIKKKNGFSKLNFDFFLFQFRSSKGFFFILNL
jgi:hypothetical protein